MSNSSAGPDLLPLADGLACCVPLAREPISAEQAATVSCRCSRPSPTPPACGCCRWCSPTRAARRACATCCPYFDLSQPTISHHLKVLHEAGLLDREKRGTWVYYIARPEAMAALGSLFTAAGATTLAVHDA